MLESLEALSARHGGELALRRARGAARNYLEHHCARLIERAVDRRSLLEARFIAAARMGVQKSK